MTATQPDLWEQATRAQDTPQQAIVGRARRKPLTLAPAAEPILEPRDRAEFVLRILDEYVAAVGTSRPRRSEARALRERATLIRSGWVPADSRGDGEAEQLEEEAAERDARAAVHEARAEKLRAQLTDHVAFPVCITADGEVIRNGSTILPHGFPHDK
jgi:hypothetical protein